MSTAIRRSLPFVAVGLIIVAALVALISTVGKGGSRFDYDGDWMGNRNLDRPDLDEVMRYTLGRVTLTVKDRRFEMTDAGVPTEGRIDFSADSIELTPLTMMRNPLPEPRPNIRVRPQADGSILLDDPRAIDGKPVKLTRKKATTP